MDRIETVKIERSAFGGYGIGKIDGKTLFVDYAIPGDTVKIKITESRKNLDFAEILEIISVSPARIKPECPNFGICGGCSYLCTDYKSEIEIKKRIVADSISRTGKINFDKIPEIEIISSERFHYRSRVKVQHKGVSGFFRKNSNEVIEFPENGCVLLDKRIIEHIKGLKKIPSDGEFHVAVDHKGKVYNSITGDTEISEFENGITYKRNITGFFQSNIFLRSRMMDKVLEYCSPSSQKKLLDIGCGGGFFSLYLAKYCKSVTGIDVSSESINYAIQNAENNIIKNTDFINSRISSLKIQAFELIIADPPRSGIEKNDMKSILKTGASKIVYVSCDPATFSRDTQVLSGNGYRLNRICMIDMFPGTYHIELIGEFISENGRKVSLL